VTQAQGVTQLVGKDTAPTMDLLIAAAARTHDAPVVTRDPRDFERVPGLDVGTY